MMMKLFRFGRRQLHTIVSRDIIKPFSPTPYHLKTYNLSLFDQLTPNVYQPIVVFYPSSSIYQSSYDKTLRLKNSLSHTLSRYYPFAGRRVRVGPTYAQVDCNDEGVDFIEATNDSPLSDFLQHSEHEDLDQLFPDGLLWYKSNGKGLKDEHIMSVQVNHFSCGGVAVAVSLSHKVADASSALHVLNHWATVTRSDAGDEHDDLSHINPHFIPYKTNDLIIPENLPDYPHGDDAITRSFVFPNSKINNLKAKIRSITTESGEPIMNPTRVEALTWLIQNSAVAAATKRNSGIFKPTGVGHILNLRKSLVEQLAEPSIGNLSVQMYFPNRNESELTPSSFIGEFRKIKKGIRGITNTDTALGIIAEMCSDPAAFIQNIKEHEDYYNYSAIHMFSPYEIDFGWGKPIKFTIAGAFKNVVILMGTPNGDGIEALVSLPREEMNIFQNDPQLLAVC